MSIKLAPYPEYKDSGLRWLGKIPEHWEVRRNGRLFAQRNQTGFADLSILEVSLKTGVRIRDFENSKRKQIMVDREKYKRAAKGDIAYNMMRMWQGAVGVAPVDGLVSPAYIVARPFRGTEARYFDYLFRTNAYMNEVDKYSRGIVKDRNRLYWDEFKQVPSAFPPPVEQKIIAEFLDRNARKVRHLIRAKRRMIELLSEQKQAIINWAVTRGLNPNVCLKPSGIDWLGNVPEHWEVKPLKRWVRVNQHSLPETTEPNYELLYIDIGAVGTGYLTEPPARIRFDQAPSRARRILRQGDTIISTVRTYLKAVYFVTEDLPNLVGSTGFAVLTPNSDVEPEFLSFLIQSDAIVSSVTANSIGVTYPAISETRLAAFHLALPPARSEQRAIIEQVRLETASLNEAVRRAQREIDLIREYRTRLIADVVTGKLDVRGVELPPTEEMELVEGMEAVEGIGMEEMTDGEEAADGDE